MQFFDWLKRQIAGSYYWYADDFEWPVAYLPPDAHISAVAQDAHSPAEGVEVTGADQPEARPLH